MKRFFSCVMIYYWGIGVAIPIIYKLVKGEHIRYFTERALVPDQYMTQAAIILTFVIFASILLIIFLPGKNKRISPKFDYGSWYYYIVIVILIFGRISLVGFGTNAYSASTSGVINGTLYSYSTMFMEPFTLLIVYFVGSKKKINIWLMELAYMVYLFICASRAAALWAMVVLMCFYFASSKWKVYRKQIIILGALLIFIAPYIFIVSTRLRASSAGGNIHDIIFSIVNRCSRLEAAAIPLWEFNTGQYNVELFQSKYGALYQLGFVIDGLIPGNIFTSEAAPCQYYRSIFLGLPKNIAESNYNSNNMTLPVYFIMKYGYLFGIVFAIILIILLYIICKKYERYMFTWLMATSVLLEILDYFDWYMITNRMLNAGLTIFGFYIVRKLFNMRIYLVHRIKRKQRTI